MSEGSNSPGRSEGSNLPGRSEGSNSTDWIVNVVLRDNFKFDVIKDYIKSLINEGIIIIPNTSKTEKEIEEFIMELGSDLPYICLLYTSDAADES